MPAQTQAGERPYLTVEDLADRYGVSVGAVRDWRRKNDGPVVTKLVGQVRYAIADVIAWEKSRRESR